MKLTILSSALAAVICSTVATSSVQAAVAAPDSSTTTTTSTTTMPSMKKVPYKGTITAVDASAKTVTVKGAKGDMTLMVTDTTKYKGGKAISDFAVGDMVTGSYTKDSTGAMDACSLHKKMAK